MNHGHKQIGNSPEVIEVLYVAMFDFAVLGLILSALVFLVWCWFAFAEDRKSHPIYRDTAGTGAALFQPKHEGRPCA